MDIEQIVAQNLQALMTHARDHDRPDICTKKGLARVAKVSRRTVQAMYGGERAVAIDTLERVAKAFGGEAWMMLVENMLISGLSTSEQWFNMTPSSHKANSIVRGIQEQSRTDIGTPVPASKESQHGEPKARTTQGRSARTGSGGVERRRTKRTRSTTD